MLLATTLTAVLLGGILSVSAALARDARRLSARTHFTPSEAVFALIRWDLANASSASASPDGLALVLIGHGGLDREMLRPNGRLCRVVYRIRAGAGLVRDQRYQDDPAHSESWSELVVAGAARIEAFPAVLDLERAGSTPLKVRIEFADGKSIERAIAVR